MPGSETTQRLVSDMDVGMKGILLRSLIAWIVLAAAFAFTDWLFDSVEIEGGIFTLLWVSLLFALVSGLLGPILRLVSLPLTLVTLGLFGLVINGALLALTAGLSDGLDVGGFGWTILAAVVISVVSTVLGFLVMPRDSVG